MNPNQTPAPQQQQGGFNDWGNPASVAKFKDYIMKTEPYYAKNPTQVDDFIDQNIQAYKNTVSQNALYNQQGGITSGQITANPQSAGNYIAGGGNIVTTGADAQSAIVNQAGQFFKKHSDKQGYASPQDYNKFLAQYNQAGGNSDAFENIFGDKYINPKNALYDTADAKAARSALPIVKNVIDSYHNLKLTGQGSKDLADIPVIGKYIQQNFLAANVAHDSLLKGEVGNIRAIAGAGPQQGFRFNLQELNNIAGLLPTSEDSKQVANDKLSELNTYMTDNMGIGLKQLYGK